MKIVEYEMKICEGREERGSSMFLYKILVVV